MLTLESRPVTAMLLLLVVVKSETCMWLVVGVDHPVWLMTSLEAWRVEAVTVLPGNSATLSLKESRSIWHQINQLRDRIPLATLGLAGGVLQEVHGGCHC